MFEVEPVLANMNSYTVLVRTPEGTFIYLSPNKAVAGPGFDFYQENRILFRVGDTFEGNIVYTTPVDVANRLKQGRGVNQVAEPPKKEKIREEIVSSASESIEWVGGGESAGSVSNSPVVQAPSVENKEKPAPTKETRVPVLERLNTMSRNELSALAKAKGLKHEGSKTALLARLGPLASKN